MGDVMDGSVVSDFLFKCLLYCPSLLEVNTVLVASLRGLAMVMQFLVGRMEASGAEYNDACLRPDGYENLSMEHTISFVISTRQTQTSRQPSWQRFILRRQ